jgi:AcrR family transcriptional regulator
VTADTPAASDVANALLAGARAELAEHGASGVSLRAVARRAGVSHAAPKHHFGDRAGLLTALAIDGFHRLTDALRRAEATGGADAVGRIGVLGRAYLDFGLAYPALFELMFRADQVHREDPVFAAVSAESFGILVGALEGAGQHLQFGRSAEELSLISWAFAHGLVVLVAGGALPASDGGPPSATARTLTGAFTEILRSAAQPEPGRAKPEAAADSGGSSG